MADLKTDVRIALEKTLDHSLEGIQIIDFDWKYRYVNETVAKQGKKTKKDLLGHTMMQCYPGIEKTEVFQKIAYCMEKRKFCSMENEFTFPDGSNAWFELRMEPVPEGVLLFSNDISSQKEIDKEKSDFISVASHALRTPLGISKWYLEAIRAEKDFTKLPKTVKQYIQEVDKSNERLLLLVRNLLSVSRIDQGKIIDTPRLIDIKHVLNQVIKAMRLIAKKDTIELRCIFETTTFPKVFLAPLKFQEVIENLISNAVKYNKPQGKVTIKVSKKKDEITIAVTDTGIGIKKEDYKKIFTKFFRAEKAIKKNTEGSGLGLYVVDSYVKDWGGVITVDSALGIGSTFSLTIPLKKSGR